MSAPAAISQPILFGDTQATWGLSFQYALQNALLVMMDMLNLVGDAFGLTGLIGDFAGSKTDTLRVRTMGGIGYAQRFGALASEVAVPGLFSPTIGYDSVALGIYGLGSQDTYKGQLLGTHVELLLEQMAQYLPASWMATLRYLICVAGSSISASVGDDATPLSVDDILDLVALVRSTRGAIEQGAPKVVLDPAQINQLATSARAEPGLQMPEAWDELQAINGRRTTNLLGLGMDVALTDDVQQSGGGYRGFAVRPGGVGIAFANTGAIRTAGRLIAAIPQMGLLMEEVASSADQGVRTLYARGHAGVMLGDSTVHFQCQIKSIV